MDSWNIAVVGNPAIGVPSVHEDSGSAAHDIGPREITRTQRTLDKSAMSYCHHPDTVGTNNFDPPFATHAPVHDHPAAVCSGVLDVPGAPIGPKPGGHCSRPFDFRDAAIGIGVDRILTCPIVL
jgi:hypothetical protein